MSKQKHLILFLGDGGNNLHLMAESFARSISKDDIGLISASMTPPKLSPTADKVMREVGIDLSRVSMLSLLDIELFTFDLIITLGDFDINSLSAVLG